MHEIDALRRNPNYMVQIDGMQGNPIKGMRAILATNEFSLGAEVTYEPAYKLAGGALEAVNAVVEPMSRMAASFGLDKLSRIKTVKNKLMQTLAWMGTSNPSFELPLLFVATRDSEVEVMNPLRELLKAVYPTTAGIGGSKGFVDPPLGYQAAGERDTKGLFSVKIGQWFFGLRFLITSVSPTLGVVVGPHGKPMRGLYSVRFEYYTLATYDEVERWFVK